MDKKNPPKRSAAFVVLSIIFILITIGFTFMWFSKIPSIEGMSYPYFELLQALVFAIITLSFVLDKKVGWYLAAGYFIFTPLYAVVYSLYRTIAVGIDMEIPASRLAVICMQFFISRDFLILLILCSAVLIQLFTPGLRGRFGIGLKQAFPGLIIVIAVLLVMLWLVPYLLQ